MCGSRRNVTGRLKHSARARRTGNPVPALALGLVLSGFGVVAFAAPAAAVACDSDTDCFYMPDTVKHLLDADSTRKFPGLLVLHCNGAMESDLDSFRLVGDSLCWVMASCHATRNHRDMMLNDSNIVTTTRKFLEDYPVDPARLAVFGYSGQAVQALAAMFLHPEMFRGVAATCAHAAALDLAVWETLNGHYVYLITRTRDWNRAENERMAQALGSNGVVAELTVTPGEHSPGPKQELLTGCRWLADRFGR